MGWLSHPINSVGLGHIHSSTVDSATLQQLIEQIVGQVLAERGLRAPEEPGPCAPLVVMTGCPACHEVVFHQLHRLNAEFGPITAILSHTFLELVDPAAFTEATGIADVRTALTRPEAEALARRASMLIIGTLTSNTRNKIANGIVDSLPTLMWASARSASLPLFVCDPPTPAATPSAPQTPPARIEQREAAMGMLRGDGAKIVSTPELFDTVKRFLLERGDPIAAKRLREKGPRPIITAEDVDRAHRRGMKAWVAPPNAIITMAAHDRARDLGLEITGGNLP